MSVIDVPAVKVRRLARETERDAAGRVLPYTGTQRRRVYDFIAGRPEGATDEEVQIALALNPSSQRPRRVELVEAGLLVDQGVRRKTGSGSAAIVWQVAPK